MLVRRIARPLFASAFVADGIEVLRDPEPHVTRAEATWGTLGRTVDLPSLDRGQMRTAVRVHGAATTLAGLLLAVGRAPRAAALTLAVLYAPLAVPEKSGGRSADERRASRQRLVERLSRIGGALIVAADTAGRPGMAWRVQHARVDKAAAREARLAVAKAAKEARTTARALRKATT